MIAGRAPGILEALARSHGVMADSSIEMSYREIAASVAQMDATLDAMLDAGKLGARDCVAFAGRNDLASAVVLLALLAGGRTFVLSAGGEARTPSFCRARLQVRAQEHAQRAMTPAIVLVENPEWRDNLPAGDACFFVPTSGSTGGAKLVRHRHESLLRAARHCAERLRLEPADRIALPVPIGHMFGLGAAFLPAVLEGASIDLQQDANVLRSLERERRFAPTVAFLIPSFAEALVRVRRSPRQYRLTVMAGDRLSDDLFDRYERLHGCLVNLYGSTELGVIAAGDPGDPVTLRRGVVGRLMPGVSLLQAPRQESRQGSGQVSGQVSGQEADDVLWFRHETGFAGYAGADGRPVREADETLASGACFRSNDVGRLIDGILVVHGRADDLVKRDGLLVACADIAADLVKIPGIADAVILAGALGLRGRALIAFCVLGADERGADGEWDAASLRRACLDRLPTRAIPDQFVFLPALPRLPSGKPDRMALRRLLVPHGIHDDADIR